MAKGELKDQMNAQEFRDYWDRREKAKESKYKAIPTETADGQKFRSHLEATYYNRVKLLHGQGDITKFEREVRFELIVNGVFVCAYVCDFIITWKDGTVEHIDCKSQATMTPVYRIKKMLMKACHGIDLKEIYQ
jgi:hypothetical protein